MVPEIAFATPFASAPPVPPLPPPVPWVLASSPRKASENWANLTLGCAVLPMLARVSAVVWMLGFMPPPAVPASNIIVAG